VALTEELAATWLQQLLARIQAQNAQQQSALMAAPEPPRIPAWQPDDDELATPMAMAALAGMPAAAPPIVQQSPPGHFVAAASQQVGLPPGLVERIIQVESGGKPRAASEKGAMGLMQLMPGTAQRFGVTDPYDPQQNVAAGTQYLRFLVDRYNGNLALAVGAYHAGEGNMDQWLAGKRSGVGPKTKAYVRKVLGVELTRG
jgi:soluble lytic murein transglycosylase-like protein